MNSIFNFYFYFDRINQSSLKLRPGTQDYQPQLNLILIS